MSKSDIDKLVDIIMGEAVLKLLESDAAISYDALIDQLRTSMHSETDPQRRQACARTLSDVRAFKANINQQDGTTEQPLFSKDSILLRFNGDPPGSNDKKH